MTLRAIISAACVLACAVTAAYAQSEPQSVTVGVLNDMAGNFSDQSGPGSLAAAGMAIEELGGSVLGKPVMWATPSCQAYGFRLESVAARNTVVSRS